MADEIIYSNYAPGVDFKLKVQPLTLEGFIAVLVVRNNQGADVYNYHPMRVGFEKVYNLKKLDDISTQVNESIKSLLSLYE